MATDDITNGTAAMAMETVESGEVLNFPDDTPNWAIVVFKNLATQINTATKKSEVIAQAARAEASQANVTSSSNKQHIHELEEKISQLERQVQLQEDYSRRNNLRIEGIPEQRTTSFESATQLEQKILDFFHTELSIEEPNQIRLEWSDWSGATEQAKFNKELGKVDQYYADLTTIQTETWYGASGLS